MRRCPRSEELRRTLAAEEPMAPDLAAHVTGCAECSRVSAGLRRFGARLDAAVADLVTDALPPTTAVAARMAPHTTRRRPTPGSLAGTLLAGAIVIFAAVGVVATGASLTEAMRGGSAAVPEPPEADLDRVDCYIDGAMVEVTVERVGASGPEGTVAYCFGTQRVDVDRQAAIQCAQSTARAAAARVARESPGNSAIPAAGDDGGSRACSLIEGTDRPVDEDGPPAYPSTQFDSWDEAAASTNWAVVRPEWLPEGYELAALQGFAEPHDGGIGSVLATYLRNGMLLSVEQFEVLDLDASAVELSLPGAELGAVSAGQTTVGDHEAFWATGVMAAPGGGPGSEVETRVLSWRDGGVGYRITARSVDLEVLERIAESLTDQ